MEHLKPNILARLYYLKTEEGGRETAFTNGYRPQMKIAEIDMTSSASQKFKEKEWVSPGDTITATITILSPQIFEGLLNVDKEFELKEGPKVVAKGRILEIYSLEPHILRN